ncbi:MAG: beta-lactamase family protein, partial [Chromatiaceae bacterium]|nr:beta-lactamase family protein [Chromatiaceae bacterium]
MAAYCKRILAPVIYLAAMILLCSCAHPTYPRMDSFGRPQLGYSYKAPKVLANGWAVSSLSEEGVDPEKIRSLIKEVLRQKYKNIDGIVIVKNGKLILEEYFYGFDRETPHDIRSVTKSISSIVTGIAIDQAVLDGVTERPYTYFKSYEPPPGWDARVRNVTIENILTMTSGYECDDFQTGFSCDIGLKDSDDWLRYALDLPMAHEPGTRWAYNSASPMLIGEMISINSGMSFKDYAAKNLLNPLSIKEFQWLLSPNGRVFVAGSAKMRPVDMAKIGYLALNRGEWKNRQIVSERWIAESTREHRSAPLHPALAGSALATSGYGYLWWTKNFSINGKIVGSFFALGNGGQMLFV